MLTELAIRCDLPVELHCECTPVDLVWIIVLEGLLTGKLNGKEKLTVPAKMIHLVIASSSDFHYRVRWPKTWFNCSLFK